MIIPCPSCSAKNRIPAARIDARAHCGECKARLSPPDRPLSISSTADFEELIRDSPLPVAVDFWAAWCAPCRVVAPQIEALATARASTVVVAKVDTETLPDVAGRQAIRSIPTIVLFRNGVEAKRVSGAMSAAQLAEGLAL